MVQKEDQHIIKRIKAGEVTAFSELIDAHQRMAFTVALNIIKNREEAEEITQDAFLKAFKSIKDFKGDSAFSSWLYRIVFNTALSKKRLKKMVTTPLDNSETHQFEMDNTMDSFKRMETNDRKRYLKKAISKLNDEDTTVVLLFYYKELSVNEISKITGLSVSNVKVKLLRSRKQLFSELSVLLKGEIANII